MKFKNDNQAKEFLKNYREWGYMTIDEFFDRRVYSKNLYGVEIIAEETAYIGKDVKYENGQLTTTEKLSNTVQYYILPEGCKQNKPMYEYRVSMSEAVKMLRKIDKEVNENLYF